MRKRGIRVSLIVACIMSMAMSFSSYAADFNPYTFETYNYFRVEENYDWLGEYMKKNHPEVTEDTYVMQFYSAWKDTTEEIPGVYRVLITNGLVYDMNTWQRKCAPYASADGMYVAFVYTKDGMSEYSTIMGDMLSESAFNKEWLDENMPNIVPEGTYIDDALRICYEWVQDNFTYKSRFDENGNNNTFTWKAQVGLETGYANCVGHASQYRNMVNYLIFDSDNKVVYLEDKEIGPAYKKLNMYVVGGNEHAWNAVRSVHDGSWLYFDPTFDDRDDGEHRYEFYSLSAEEFYDGKEYMVGIKEPHTWIRGIYTSSVEYYSQELDDINLVK